MNRATLATVVLLVAESGSLAQQAQLAAGDSHASSTELAHSLGPQNPWLADGGAATEHNDAFSSNVTPLGGPARSASASLGSGLL